MTRRLNAYEKAIQGLCMRIMEMGNKVDGLVADAMTALINQDVALANRVIEGDSLIDDLDHHIEIGALELISWLQPTADDLRTLAGIMRITRDLERIADYAVNIAEMAVELSGNGEYFKPLVDIPKMAEMARSMLENSLLAFLERDTGLAHEVNLADAPVDRLFYALYDELIGYMKRDPRYIDQASRLSLVARYLERIGDHAVNIAETAIYISTGNRRPFKGIKADATD